MKSNKKDKNKIDIRQIENDFHYISFDELRKRFNTSLEFGLESNIASQLLIDNGKNQIKSYKKNIFFTLFKYLFGG